ncbi:GAF domain-containing protein [Deinococcus alpinitundrae]|uniref:GAF domain-containing protein n=1 Tax=Deinococcus alpinitundrae TaxID=468913 RepID=UPI001379B1F3|nr:GAF domain-containing protein [Deinococcus alpinitundrae]
MPLSTETRLQEWLQFIELLGRIRNPEDVVRAVIDEGIEAIGADGGFVSLRSSRGTELEFVGSYAYPTQLTAFLESVPLTTNFPFVEAYNRREALFLESLDQVKKDYPEIAVHLRDYSGSVVDLPLLVGNEALGILVLSFREGRTFSLYERTFLRILAGQCAHALHRSQALQQERLARHRAEALQERFAYLSEASAVLNASLDLKTTLETITILAVPRLADWCSLSLPEGDLLVPVAIAHQDQQKLDLVWDFVKLYPVNVHSSGGGALAFRSGEAQLFPVITEEMIQASSADPKYVATIQALELHSLVSVPMIAPGGVVGVLSLASSRAERTYTTEDIPFTLEIARRAALAVENAKLYETAQREIESRQKAQQQVAELNTVLEQRVKDRTQALEAANAGLEAFTYSASHDLRTPVRHIKSFAELLERQLDADNSRAIKLLGHIQDAAKRMDEITEGLLDLSRVTMIHFKEVLVPLDVLVREVIDELSVELGQRQVRWEVETLPAVVGDPKLLRQVFQNVLGNAVKYTRPRTEARIGVHAYAEAGEVVVRVSDNGVGYDPRFADKLFGVFQRLHRSDEFEGSGVGLATVQRIVSRHGGRIWG